MSTHSVVTVGERDPELAQRLSDELDIYNADHAGAGDQHSLSVRATSSDGELLGGLQGWTWAEAAGWAMVWVHDGQRGTGLGRRLLEAAETEAVARGCVRAFVSSFSFQAPGFYRRHGYLEFARSAGLPLTGAADIHFVKQLLAPGGLDSAQDHRTAMWEAKAADGRDGELLDFALAHAPAEAQIYRSADARVVVIDPTGAGLPEPPAGLLARPAHVWRFDRVTRT